MKSIAYWNPFIYSLFMRFSYKSNYLKRYQEIASLIDAGSSLVDVCCGDCKIYKFLKDKNIAYTGLDFNSSFVNEGNRKGMNVQKCNVKHDEIPQADYVLMQASLYQFIPNHGQVLQKLYNAAKKYLIIAEPVKNYADSKWKIVSFIAKLLNNPGDGIKTERFNINTLKEALEPFTGNKVKEFLVADTEYVVLIKKDSAKVKPVFLNNGLERK